MLKGSEIAIISVSSTSAGKLPVIFVNVDFLLAFGIALLIWIASEIVGGRIIPSLRRGGSKVEKRRRGLNVITWVGWVVFFAISLNLASLGIALLPDWAFFLGIATIMIGVGVRQWAVAALGRYFSNVIGVQANQKVVQIGPYRFVRHPSYTGIFLIQVGIALALQSWAAVLAAGIIFGLVYGHRMLSEEKFLVKELGNDYLQYMNRTKRIIPFLV